MLAMQRSSSKGHFSVRSKYFASSLLVISIVFSTKISASDHASNDWSENESELVLRRKDIYEEDIKILVYKLQSDTKIGSINLNFNQVGKVGAEYLNEIKKYYDAYLFLRQKYCKDMAQYIFAQVLALHEKDHLGEFVSIPGGEYRVGALSVNMKEQLSIGSVALTQESFVRGMGKNPSFYHMRSQCPLSYMIMEVDGQYIEVCAGFPVENVYLADIKEYIHRLNKRDPKYNYRLPTGSELEVALGGGVDALYDTGRNDHSGLESIEWHQRPFRTPQAPVKSTKNAFGIYPSSIPEWVSDTYYEGSNSLHDANKYHVALRCKYDAKGCLLAERFPILSKQPDPSLGFRLVRYEKKVKDQKSLQHVKKATKAVKKYLGNVLFGD